MARDRNSGPTGSDLGSAISRHVHDLVARISALPDVKGAVEANHDENRWWPSTVTDPRMRTVLAGWSTRVSYAMIDTYARVVTAGSSIGFDRLTQLPDEEVARLMGLEPARCGRWVGSEPLGVEHCARRAFEV